ncbi:hypothetical protein Salat_1145000 [Sesamum alatum]|uniref:Reverse transcriptase zinc-binding domain-containing protein n=1 Tax=Sesamum alatum TaxID=300844 RepID=A0AAE1YDY1_9LAMI|nr:hypothetical protein Salat_1145000 [Sesamum alatum]
MPPGCLLCGSEIEDSRHVILDCSFARQTWALSNIPWCKINCWNDSVADWLRSLKSSLDTEHFERATTVAWALWRHRNKVLFEQYATCLLLFYSKHFTSWNLNVLLSNLRCFKWVWIFLMFGGNLGGM